MGSSSSSSTADCGDGSTSRNGSEHKSQRLVRYLSENHDWQSYSNDEELFVQEFPKVRFGLTMLTLSKAHQRSAPRNPSLRGRLTRLLLVLRSQIELHVHLDGAFDPDFLWNYMRSNPESLLCLPVSVELPWAPSKTLDVRKLVEDCETPADFHRLCTCRGNRSLKAMLNCFEIFMPLVRRNLDLIEQLAFDFCQRQWEQNTIYTEVRYSPHFLAESFQAHGDDEDRKADADLVYASVTRGLRRGCRKFSITVNQILCALTWRPDWAMPTLEMVKKYRNDYPCATVGVDIAAGEEHFNAELHPELFRPHFEMIQRARTDSVPITLHAGESTDHALDNVRKAIVEYGASRVGHGYRLVQSRQLMKQVKDSKVHVEICPTSSLETGGWVFQDEKNWREHPCITMKECGISFSLSSDDPAVFHTSLAWQYRIALAKMDFTREDVLETNLHAINAAFCSGEEKKRLRALVHAYGSFKRLRSDVSEHPSHAATGDQRRDWRRSVSDSFADRVYISRSQYF